MATTTAVRPSRVVRPVAATRSAGIRKASSAAVGPAGHHCSAAAAAAGRQQSSAIQAQGLGQTRIRTCRPFVRSQAGSQRLEQVRALLPQMPVGPYICTPRDCSGGMTWLPTGLTGPNLIPCCLHLPDMNSREMTQRMLMCPTALGWTPRPVVEIPAMSPRRRL